METKFKLLTASLVLAASAAWIGCGSTKTSSSQKEFFTSGNQQADQRASQRMAQSDQLSGSGSHEKDVQETVTNATNTGTNGAGTNKMLKAVGKVALYDRLGGQTGISNIVSDFLPRAMEDPRVNWDRTDVTRGGLSFTREESVTWNPTSTNVALLKKHLTEFLCLATGGPANYHGKEIQQTHAHMHISNAEFDATIGDLKASLDRLQIPNTEQKELLAIVESTRPEIVTER